MHRPPRSRNDEPEPEPGAELTDGTGHDRDAGDELDARDDQLTEV